jgi:hypothetical protein
MTTFSAIGEILFLGGCLGVALLLYFGIGAFFCAMDTIFKDKL